MGFDAIFSPEQEGFENKENFIHHLGRCVNTFKIFIAPQEITKSPKKASAKTHDDHHGIVG